MCCVIFFSALSDFTCGTVPSLAAVAQNLDLPVNARGPPGGDSAEVNDEHESEQEDDNNILDNPDDEDYRYNVAEDDGSQSYFDLVQVTVFFFFSPRRFLATSL